MDTDLDSMSRDGLVAEVKKLRQGIREHRDSTGQELCWHHPQLWSLLPEPSDPLPSVPEWPQFLRGCVRYRESLDEQIPQAPRTDEPYRERDTELQIVVNVDVDDLEKAIAFYTTGLGLRLGRRLFDGSVAEMLGAPSTIHLLSKPSGSAAVPKTALSRQYDRHWTPLHLDFAVDDVSAAVERAIRAGATLEGEIQSYAWGRLATMSDPFGHGFCVVQFMGNGYDEVS